MKADLQDVVLRPVCPADAGQLIRLWCAVFGDPPELVGRFLSLLPDMGTGCAAERGGQILGAAYLIRGFTLLRPGAAPLRCGYLYAVAVDPSARGFGLGSAISRGAAELGRREGAELLCTLPAEASLYRWYGDILSLTQQSTRKLYFCDRLPEAEPVSAATYLRRREALLEGRPHVAPNGAAMEFESELCRIYGGGLFAAGDAIFCAYPEDGFWRIPEFLPQPADGTVPGLRAELLPFLCADRPFPDGLVWNLTFD